ncbi:hypothetical protein TcasGA2_TC014511 [Tribolium castaneum]|uniref:Uncharacterized protein n=1 Tax=Tribolium castaneum TaxID=7070 RepID=D6WP62_TRICA|nr:hypothetical protein TcasGA2_TC014511 [Tribolium castaneum]
MVLQVLDLVSPSSEPFYGDCPQTYTDLDINATGHTTCTVIPQGKTSSRRRQRIFGLTVASAECSDRS